MHPADDGLKDLKILIVDDSAGSLNLIRSMLTDMGIAQVFTAKDGDEAIDFLGAFDGGSLDVVLCDWKMPRMTGIDVLKQVRMHDPKVAFLMISGVADQASIAEAKSCGVTGYIKKPFSADELRKRLQVVSRDVLHRNSSIAG